MSKQLTKDSGATVAELLVDPVPIPEPPEPPDINIQSTANGAAVVGTLPGVTVNLSGSGWTPLRSRPIVKVKLGATDTFRDGATVSTPSLDGTYFWSFSGVTTIGGPIQVTAQ